MGEAAKLPREHQQQRLERILELAPRLTAARAEVARLEAELDALMGGGALPTLPLSLPSTEEAKQEESAPSPRPNGVQAVDRKALIAERAKGGPRGRSDQTAAKATRTEIIQLTKQGIGPTDIEGRLGLSRAIVAGHLFRARQAGQLPKAKANR